jgi:hypothetical protein
MKCKDLIEIQWRNSKFHHEMNCKPSRDCTTPQGSSGAFLAEKKIKLSNIFYVKETVQVVPENTYNTHRDKPSSVASVSSVGTMVMFLSLD